MTLSNRLSFFFLLVLTAFQLASPAQAAEASLQFVPDRITTTLSSPFTVEVALDTSGYEVGGAGAIINYDTFMLTPTAIKTSDIFADYPISAINNLQGKITISGIASSTDTFYLGKGVFATITFLPKQLGSTTLDFAYEPGSTTDSNIAVSFGNGDVLTKVNTLTVLINPDQVVQPSAKPVLLDSLKTITPTSLKHKLDELIASLNLPFLRDKYASLRPGRPISKQLEPLAPITHQAPITDAYNTQPVTTNLVSSGGFDLVQVILISLTIILILPILVIIFRQLRKHS